MKLLLLDMNEMESEEAVHNYLMENWRFPTIMEKSDALSDMLTDGAAGNVWRGTGPLYGTGRPCKEI